MSTSELDLPSDIENINFDEVKMRIVNLNTGITQFWSSSQSWAPIEAADLLSKSRLDRQVSISKTLDMWKPEEDHTLSEGKLIFAWVNLGALVEGTLKWFLSVYYEEYKADIKNIKNRSGNTQSPDGVMLQALRLYFKESVWTEHDDFDNWISKVQGRRNAIHAYKHREIGDWDSFERSVREYLFFLRSVHNRVPYPDEAPEPVEVYGSA